ncbi:type 1 glutamine amidotransferase [Candidatus Woesearchaeota archaeon]|nr:type 1 glutamine amidotransferase [Candidatus Woesearchaeota archaeon]
MENKKIAILAAPDFNDLELMYPYYRLKEEGFDVKLVGMGEKFYKGKYGIEIEAELNISDVGDAEYDAVIIPGGWAPDFLRRDEKIVKFVKDMFENGKVVASICHGGSVLVSADILKGKKVTSFFGIKDDLVNAGAEYEDNEVVVDGNLITSRKPDDLPAFCKEIIQALNG